MRTLPFPLGMAIVGVVLLFAPLPAAPPEIPGYQRFLSRNSLAGVTYQGTSVTVVSPIADPPPASTVPEPDTIFLVLMGVGLLAIARFKMAVRKSARSVSVFGIKVPIAAKNARITSIMFEPPM